MKTTLKISVMAAFAIFFIFSFCSCSSSKAGQKPDNYLKNAKRLFNKAQASFDDEQYEKAIASFEHIKSHFSYSNFAALSDLKIADCYFELEKWLDAADSYDFFIKFHPRHKMVALAYFKLAESYFKAIPSDFFLFSKSYSHDQKATKDSLVSVERYLEVFPNDANAKEAWKIKSSLLEELAKHEIEVANFYAAKKKWFGALARYNRVVTKYPATTMAAQALYELAKITKKHTEEPQKAREYFKKLQLSYPKSKFAKMVTLSMLQG